MYSIYKITETATGKIYVGVSKSLAARMRTHKSREFLGRPFEYEVLCKASDENSALAIESFWIEKLEARRPEVGYNKKSQVGWNKESSEKHSASQRRRTDRPFLGKKHTEETRAIMSAMKKGKRPSAAGWNSTPVKNLDTGETFQKISLACEKHGLHKAAISRCCKGLQKTSGGFRWSFL